MSILKNFSFVSKTQNTKKVLETLENVRFKALFSKCS